MVSSTNLVSRLVLVGRMMVASLTTGWAAVERGGGIILSLLPSACLSSD